MPNDAYDRFELPRLTEPRFYAEDDTQRLRRLVDAIGTWSKHVEIKTIFWAFGVEPGATANDLMTTFEMLDECQPRSDEHCQQLLLHWS